MYLYNRAELNEAIKRITSQPVEIYFGPDELIFATTPPSVMPRPFRILSIISHKADFLIHTVPEQDDQAQMDLLKGVIKHFLDLNFSTDPSQQLQHSDKLRLINLLSGGEEASEHDIKKLSSQLNYHYDMLRCAVVFNMRFDRDILEITQRTSFQAFFLDTVQSELSLDREDIYSFMGFEKFILFKHIVPGQPEKELDQLDASLSRIRDAVMSKYAVEIELGMGGAYNSLAQLDHSFHQAMFLISCHDQLSDGDRTVLHIEDFLYEYFSNLLPQCYIDRKYERFAALSKESPALYETFRALNRNNHVLVAAAKELGMHRNTLSQRMKNMKRQLGIDPLYLDDDRFKVRQFYIVSRKKTVLSAGIVIQDDSALHLGYDRFAKLLNENSDGSILLNIRNVSLSGDNENLIQLLRNGYIDFAVAALTSLNQYTNFRMSTLELPFLFDTPAQAHEILDGPVGRTLMDLLEPSEIVGLGFWSMGWRHISSNTPIRTPDDLRGLKIRIMYNNIMQKFYEHCGAIPAKMKYGHVSLALMQKLIDGQDNPYTNIKSMEFYLYQRYVSEINHCYDLVAFSMSRQSWNKLDGVQRDIIRRSAVEATKWQREASKRCNDTAKQWLLKNKLLECVSPTAEERHEWLEIIKPLYASHPFQEDLWQLSREKAMLAARGIL